MNKQNVKYSNRYQPISFSEDINDTTHNAGEGQHSIFK
jgi:hypothetical protein